MRTLKLLLANIAILYSTVWCAPACAQPFFMGLGDLPGGVVFSSASAVSADGSVVVGKSTSTSSRIFRGVEAFRWTQIGGMMGLGDLPGGVFYSSAAGVSADGSVVVGSSTIATQCAHYGCQSQTGAFRWTQAGGMAVLGNQGAIGVATAVSADGSVAVGSAGGGFRWTQATGMQDLDDVGTAADVSADGSVIVGSTSTNPREAMRWTQSGGTIGLGDLPGGALYSLATGVSNDGTVVVGGGTSAAGNEAFRWSADGGMVSLGILPGFNASLAQDVSADGSLVVGYSGDDSFTPRQAFLWDATHGMRSLRELLVNDFGLGASLADWTLTSANGISADGRSIVGSGTNPNGKTEAWLARLVPLPTLPGDYNANGIVDAADYTVWRDRLGQIESLPNDDTTGVGPDDYDRWKMHFGEVAGGNGPGSGAAGYPLGASAAPLPPAVPEPATFALAALGLAALAMATSRLRKCNGQHTMSVRDPSTHTVSAR